MKEHPTCPECGYRERDHSAEEFERRRRHEARCEAPRAYVCTDPGCETCGGRLGRIVSEAG